ncbi:MAG: hypothetical protein Q8M83_02655 [bacterium]|nr:hypothetical protein [bacterium]
MSNFFQQLRKSYSSYESERRAVIKNAGDALSFSKQAIFSLHRDDPETAAKLLKEVENIFSDLEKKFKKELELRFEGSYRAAMEEYVEAKMFERVTRGQKVGEIKEAAVDTDSYLGGICDLIGEMARKVVLLATERKFDKVKRLAEAAHEIMAELIKMDLTGYMRNKYDQAKQALRKIEEVAYDIAIKSVK